ncbi:FAD-dependent oxidoreductase [Candidatus Aerophobetes bacterium]|nr:FAD-dependent oxidoreductase [Candidatus Aerophobetes bacterium]
MNGNNKKIGAVMVVGGGIGGIQASLDLAESGFRVYLVEKKPGIGGVMAQLDKTFPTNDCSMCILSPKLLGAGRNQNIEIISYADLEKVEGEAGNFKISLKKKSTFVNSDKCTGCAECEDKCPVEVLSEFDEGLTQRKAIYRLYPQVVPNVFTIEKNENKAPCKITCPAGVNVQGYIALISEGKFREAYELIKERLPFPGVLGRICQHPCEEKCNRKELDEPVAIAGLKRFVADYVEAHKEEYLISNEKKDFAQTKEKKVAVIGAGPAGVTCACDLAKSGYEIVIFEANSYPGGMMYSGIPDYRLPGQVLTREIEKVVKETGIKILFNRPIRSKEDFQKLRKDYPAIFIAIGAGKSKKLKLAGSHLKGVLYGVEFLKNINEDKKVKVGEKVAVIGGGNVAIDVALSSLRIGAKEVHLFCPESRHEMPAFEWEIEEALKEGVIIHPSRGPKKIIGEDGKVTGLETILCTQVFDSEGKFNPKFKEKTESIIFVDSVIIAIGQEIEPAGFETLKFTPTRLIDVDEISLATSMSGVFAGGDVVSGPASVVEAVSQGHAAAISIDRYLKGEDLRTGREKVEEKAAEVPQKEVKLKKRKIMPCLSLDERKGNFKEIELGFTEDMAVDEAKRCINCGVCSECLECVKACKAEAIFHDMLDEKMEIEVGSIILAPGFDEFNPRLKKEYGYGRFPNVLTSIEFERILSASGPFQGHVVRCSDKKTPKKIAWIQCVGSRDVAAGLPYCSSVCCMYATKEAIIAKEHVGSHLACHIYFIDMRCFGKDFDRYYERAKTEYGVDYRRCRVSSLDEDSKTKNLKIRYETEDGSLKEEEYDLVVLSIGLVPPRDMLEVADKLAVCLNEYNFLKTGEFSPVKTTKKGVFACGAILEPKDIPETVTSASGACALASALLSSVRGTLVAEKKYPAEKDVSGDIPRIGVFVCQCGINIGGVVNVPLVVEYAKTLPFVVYAEDNLYTCSQDTQDTIKEAIAQHSLNRVVVASCTPRTHEPLFQETIREAGLNRHLFEMANIRDQNSWVHMKQPREATEKAKDLVRMAVAKVCLKEPLLSFSSEVIQKALVIGGGLAGMVACFNIAEQGFAVYLVEKELELGGNVRNIHRTLESEDVQTYLKSMIKKVEENPKIKVYKGAKIEEIQGYVGNYRTLITQNGEQIQLEHGVIVVTTGAKELKPEEYLYGEDEKVVTQLELEKMMAKPDFNIQALKNIVMIQCVGSREEERMYCSRVCCSDAVKNALRIKKENPAANVFILYRDMRTYGFKEKFYQQAREKGIIFIRYDKQRKPCVRKDTGVLKIDILDPVLKKRFIMRADLLVLSCAIVPNEDNEALAKLLKVPLTEDGFYLEAHVKLRPVDFSTRGIFLAGMAHSPKFISETISQALASAQKACAIITRSYIESEATVARVNERWCRGCGACVSACPYEAIAIDEEANIARVTEVLCQGCGSCSVACPSGAIAQRGFERRQLLSMIDAAVEGVRSCNIT